jgi:hypothetical protein
MATVQQGLQAQICNIEATYGKPMSEWFAIISASGLTRHTDVVSMLKKDYGMTHDCAPSGGSRICPRCNPGDTR